jgi:hypothetical protein
MRSGYDFERRAMGQHRVIFRPEEKRWTLKKKEPFEAADMGGSL